MKGWIGLSKWGSFWFHARGCQPVSDPTHFHVYLLLSHSLLHLPSWPSHGLVSVRSLLSDPSQVRVVGGCWACFLSGVPIALDESPSLRAGSILSGHQGVELSSLDQCRDTWYPHLHSFVISWSSYRRLSPGDPGKSFSSSVKSPTEAMGKVVSPPN